MNSMQESLPSLVENPDASALHRYVDRIVVDQRLLGIFICRPDGMQLIRTPRVPENVSCDSTSGIANEGSLMLQAPSGSVQVSAFTERFKGEAPYRVGVVHDLSFIDRRQTTARDYLMLFAAIAVLTLGLLVVVAFSFCCGAGSAMLIRDIRSRRFLEQRPVRSAVAADPVAGAQGAARDGGEPAPGDRLPRELDTAGVAAGGARAAALAAASSWSPTVSLTRTSAPTTAPSKCRCRPAAWSLRSSRSCAPAGGTWVAHGSGSADREVVDRHDRVLVPPEDPSYTLAARVAVARGRRRLLLRALERGAVAAVPPGLCAPGVSQRGLAGISVGEPPLRGGRGARRRSPRIR